MSEIRYAIINQSNYNKIFNPSLCLLPEGWSKGDFREVYKNGVKYFYVICFYNNIAKIEYLFDYIFENVQDFDSWTTLKLDIIKVVYDHESKTATILCNNGLKYISECKTEWLKTDCVNFISQKVKFEDGCVGLLPKSKLLQYKDTLLIDDKDILLKDSFILFFEGNVNKYVELVPFVLKNDSIDLQYIIEEYNIENMVKLDGVYVFDSFYKYYEFYKNKIK